MAGLPIDQLLDVTACVVPLLDRDEVAAWTSLDYFESVIVTTLDPRQHQTEDFIAANFDVSQATISRRRAALEGPITAALADLEPVPAETARGDTVLVDGTLVPTSGWSDQHHLLSGKHHRTGMNVQVAAPPAGRCSLSGHPPTGPGTTSTPGASRACPSCWRARRSSPTSATSMSRASRPARDIRLAGPSPTGRSPRTSHSPGSAPWSSTPSRTSRTGKSSSTTGDPSTGSNKPSAASKRSTDASTHTGDTPRREERSS